MADGGVLAVALMENGGGSCQGGRDGRLLAFLRDASAANCYVGHGEPIDGQARPTNAQNVSCVACEGISYYRQLGPYCNQVERDQ